MQAEPASVEDTQAGVPKEDARAQLVPFLTAVAGYNDSREGSEGVQESGTVHGIGG